MQWITRVRRAGIVELRGMDVGGAFGLFAGDLVDRSVRASLLFSSALCFQRVTTARPQPFSFSFFYRCLASLHLLPCHTSCSEQPAHGRSLRHSLGFSLGLGHELLMRTET